MGKSANDFPTIACIGVLAMCLVTADHEAFGHGGACLFLHGHITLLSSSIFHCDVRSGWIDPAGPAGNLLGGTIALILSRLLPAERTGLRLFFIAVTAFSWFWEGAYVADAMYRQSGDLYFFAQFMLGDVMLWERWLFAGLGIVLYLFAARLTARALLELWPNPSTARSVARTVWLGATLGAGAAALAFRGQGWGDLRDAMLEIGVASLALLVVPRDPAPAGAGETAVLSRDYRTIALAAIVFAIFTLTLGRGVGASPGG